MDRNSSRKFRQYVSVTSTCVTRVYFCFDLGPSIVRCFPNRERGEHIAGKAQAVITE